MFDRAKKLQILVESNRRSLILMRNALEELEAGSNERTNYSTLQRGFHTIKHDAKHLQLNKLAELAASCEAIVERANEQRVGLPLDVLTSATKELEAATETIAAGGRHKLDRKIAERARKAAASAAVEH